jgi:hypothetical protein
VLIKGEFRTSGQKMDRLMADQVLRMYYGRCIEFFEGQLNLKNSSFLRIDIGK